MKARAISMAVLLLSSSLCLWAQADSKPTEAAPKAAENSAQSEDSEPPVAGENASDRKWHLRLGAVTLGAGYFRGPLFYPYAPLAYYPFYAQALWDPFWNPFWDLYYPGQALNLGYADDKGEVRLTGAPKSAKIYLDGAYAGTADRLKHMWLDPGAYDLAVSVSGRDTFRQRIYILTGKTLKVAADQAPNTPER